VSLSGVSDDSKQRKTRQPLSLPGLGEESRGTSWKTRSTP
jgi:hypothetical protein